MKNTLSLLVLLLLVGQLPAQTFQWNTKSGSAHPKEVTTDSPALRAYDRAMNERQTGLAGIYNPNARGSRTVYGETYNPSELTASHAILPLGTLARVTNLDNNQQVTVRINDRGQECQDCLLQLSQAAASQLGINYRARVSVERAGFSNWNPAPPAAAPVALSTPATYQYQPAPRAAYPSTPATYSTPAPVAAPGQPRPGVVRPATIGNQAYGWEPKAAQPPAPAPSATGSYRPAPQVYGQAPRVYANPNPGPTNQGALGTPANGSVTSREVTPANGTGYVPVAPATYSRYPTTVTPAYTPAPRPATTVAPPPPTVRPGQTARAVAAPAVYATPAPTAAPATAANYVVQIGAYSNEMYARNRVAQLQAAGLPTAFYRAVRKPDGQVINRVYSGTYPTAADAQRAATDIRTAHNIAGIVARQ